MRLAVTGEGPTVVKLAGIGGGTGLYREEIEAAVRAGFRVAALDTTGDRHDDPAPGALTWDGLAADVASGIASLGVERAILWGTSYGCLVALATAVRHPERVSGLVLCHPPDPSWRPRLHSRLVAWTRRRPNADGASRWLFTLFYLSATSWEALSPWLWIRLPGLARASLDARTPGRTIHQKVELLWDEDPGTLRVPGIPASIIAGAWDLVAPSVRAMRVAVRVPGALYREMYFSGHAGAYARPGPHRRMVLEELRRVAGDGPREGPRPASSGPRPPST